MSGHNGDETFERWFREYHRRLVAQCRRIVGDAAAAEDIAQETLLRAWLGRERMREEDLGAWLTVVARNLCISHLRRQKKQIPTEFLPETPDEAADPARLVERMESRRAVRRAMNQIGDRHRVLLLKREIEGVDYEELSADTGLTPGGTRTVLFRARRMLRDQLAAVGEGMAAFVGVVKVRFRSMLGRGRSSAGNAGAVLAPAAPAMLNLFVALGVTVTVLGSSGAFASGGSTLVSQNLVTSVKAPAPTSSTPGVQVEAAEYHRQRNDLTGRLLDPPKLPPPNGKVRPYRCGEGDTLARAEVAGEPVEVYNYREEGEFTQPLYDVEDVVFDAASDRAPEMCDRLGEPIEVSP